MACTNSGLALPVLCAICNRPLLHSESLSMAPAYVHMDCRKRYWKHLS